MSVSLSLDVVPHDQIGGENAYVARLAPQHPRLHPHLGRQAGRRKHSRFAGTGTGGDLRHGSGLIRLSMTLPDASDTRFLCHSRQVEYPPTRIFGIRGSQHENHLRSDHSTNQHYQPQELSRTSASYPIQGSRDGQDAGVSHQQLHLSGYSPAMCLMHLWLVPGMREVESLLPALFHIEPLLCYLSGRICGNKITSRMLGLLVSSITSRSIPIPSPAVGGKPYSNARM